MSNKIYFYSRFIFKFHLKRCQKRLDRKTKNKSKKKLTPFYKDLLEFTLFQSVSQCKISVYLFYTEKQT